MDIAELREVCRELVLQNYNTISSLGARSMIFAFWKGVMAVEPCPYAEICLRSGRYKDLV